MLGDLVEAVLLGGVGGGHNYTSWLLCWEWESERGGLAPGMDEQEPGVTSHVRHPNLPNIGPYEYPIKYIFALISSFVG